jgi:hypothetical protein
MTSLNTIKNEVKKWDTKFKYQILSRLQQDCEYFIYTTHVKHLWAGDIPDHIKYMKVLYKSFKIWNRPKWLTYKQIKHYEKIMNK